METVSTGQPVSHQSEIPSYGVLPHMFQDGIGLSLAVRVVQQPGSAGSGEARHNTQRSGVGFIMCTGYCTGLFH